MSIARELMDILTGIRFNATIFPTIAVGSYDIYTKNPGTLLRTGDLVLLRRDGGSMGDLTVPQYIYSNPKRIVNFEKTE